MKRGHCDLQNPLLQRDCPVRLYPNVHFLGVPVHKGQPKNGTQLGPTLIRNSNLVAQLGQIGVNVVDHGDVDVGETNEPEEQRIFGMRNLHSFINSTVKIAEAVEEILSASLHTHEPDGQQTVEPLVLLGGDHSLATGSILGHRRVEPNACVIWVDAHADINTPLTSDSGNIHGMPVAFILEELQDEIPWMEDLEPIKPCLRAKDIVYIGLRDLDPHEVYDLRRNGIVHFTMADLDRIGIDRAIRGAIEAVDPRLERPIHLSFDIDAMDPSIAPSTGTEVAGGLSLREGLRICEEVYATGKLSVIDMVEINPLIGSSSEIEKTQTTAVQLLKTCLGYRRSGHLPFKVRSLTDEGICSRADKDKRMFLE
ncbi:unnamed protein product [Calicophoron daubneyi]|uniref:Arginase n=1 Tax=Calicophoron daubneyi TaxID=300641 RepID=A0AAV2TYD1_CALDB